eukprot:CAMPEP_0169470014 /NCGR_PEP_ID=MMETSP1042-20121227/23791_1 /TAXON_ID=464988 /ORGANISM="Hemiselmis andersenii, Strain CCMP1180" /LENGTH=72 /DNA_ID=CAMNT_0009583537 /DNA_START=115 /DNA_END=330 /DNA_ORIENTATION=+
MVGQPGEGGGELELLQEQHAAEIERLQRELRAEKAKSEVVEQRVVRRLGAAQSLTQSLATIAAQGREIAGLE